MAQQPSKGQESEKSFARFLSEQPSVTEARTVALNGTILRSEKEGMFVLNTPDGQSLELSVDAVKGYRMMADAPGERMVQLDLYAHRVTDQLSRLTLAVTDTVKEGAFDTWKESPADTLKELINDPTLKEAPWDTFKEGSWDTLKEQISDPSTWVEGIGGGTLQETIGGPGGLTTNPAFNQAAGAMPFVMATPHHASTAPQMMQMQLNALGGGVQKSPALDGALATSPRLDQFTLKEGPSDTLKEMIQDPTFKEGPWDTLKEVIHDTLKEQIADPTWVEGIGGGGGTLQEGIGGLGGLTTNPAVWGFPGLMM